jgi:hypothetical protein
MENLYLHDECGCTNCPTFINPRVRHDFGLHERFHAVHDQIHDPRVVCLDVAAVGDVIRGRVERFRKHLRDEGTFFVPGQFVPLSMLFAITVLS